MHRKTPISVQVYYALFPNPSPSDPQSFSAHLSKNLVGEVRIETATFYGSLDTIEARYPGLNYTYPPHRKRLSRFPHHRRLFEVFDQLGLTDSEILGFCRWEGTLWARERYERDEGVKVKDTTGMEIQPWVDRRKSRPATERTINVKTDIEVEIQKVPDAEQNETTTTRGTTTEVDTSMRDVDVEDSSVNTPLDPEWEQILKEAQERGELNPELSGQLGLLAAQAVLSRFRTSSTTEQFQQQHQSTASAS